MKIRYALAAAAMAAALPAVASATPGVSFLIDGNTANASFSFSNTSTAGQKITGFGFDLSTVPSTRPGSRLYFDTAGSGSTPFSVVGGTGALTGLIGAPTIPDNAQSFELGFNDFSVGEAFRFSIDIDGTGTTAIFGDDLIGASVWFMFDNNTRVEGKLYAVAGNTDASQFVTDRIITSGVPEPATWAMLITGFGMAGTAIRRRRTAAALA